MGKESSDKDQEHDVQVLNEFEMKTMKDYHNLHIKCDVLLLAHTFGNFRNHSLKNDGLSPSRYLSAPDLNWYATLNMTKFQLEHISDVDMYFFFEKDIKGGVSYISKIYCQVDNKFL